MVGRKANLTEHAMNMMEKYAESLESKTRELDDERQRADDLLVRMLPK